MPSRRDFLGVATIGAVTAISPQSSVADCGKAKANNLHPPKPTSGRLHDLWNAQVRDLVTLPIPGFSDGAKERYTLYSSLLMALVAYYWNGNKYGREGTYPWRARQRRPNGQYLGGDYLGHNIASLAVDGKGEIIDFDFSHSDLFNSSVEHSESRLIRRVFSLAQVYNGWTVKRPTSALRPNQYGNILNDVAVYTTLEPCSQCSGIMAIGSVKEVIFLQRDPSQNSIGNILHNLNAPDSATRAPLPIPADSFNFGCFDDLDKNYRRFAQAVPMKPFYVGPPETHFSAKTASMTSFLCTDDALRIFKKAGEQFHNAKAAYPMFKPTDVSAPAEDCLSNAEVVEHMGRFYLYATTNGRRGTPHKL